MSLAASQTGPDLANGRNGDDFADALDALDGTRRRSLRKREEKSYAESPDLIIEEDSNNPGGRLVGTGVLGPGAKTPHPSALASKDPYPGTIINNGDIEMESENEEDEISAPVTDIPLPKDYSCEELTEKRALIKRLQTRLRNDEMSLVILKKIRHSQVLAEQAAVASAAKATAAAAAAASATLAASNASVSVIKNGSSLAKGGHPSHKMSNSIRSSMANITPVPSKMPDLSQLTPVNVDPKNLPPSLPANLVNLMSSGALGAKVTPMSSGRGSLDVSKQSHKMPVDTETPAQKQAAAKMALRKQLEKTLLQIPPPKPPPPEMHFIPNPTNSEFICLLGLEECVGKILHENKENTSQPMPFSCSQCSTDFTPTWKWDKGSRGKDVKVICENCVTTNVKKALKAEHTNRLKAAFVKALQQEQELEAHMAATGSVSASPSPNPVTISPAHRVASPDTRDRGPPRSTAGHGVGSGLDVTIRSTPNSSSRSAPSAHQSRPISSVNSHHQSSSSGAHRSSNHSRSAYSTSNMSSSRHRNHASSSGSSSVKATTSSSSSSQAAAAAQAAASLMGGYDLASLAAIQQMQQQMLLGLAGGTATSQASAVGSGRGGGMSSSSNSSSNNAAAALSNQLAAMNQLMANPLLYNYQALAMAQAMQAAAGSGGGSSGGASKGSSSSGGGSGSNSATNQMLEIQRQAAEQIQRQYLLDMIPPGSLAQSWGSKK